MAAGQAEPAHAARRWVTDALIAVLVTALSLAGAYGTSSWHHQQAANLAGYLLTAAGGMSLVARRRYPVAVLAVTLACALLSVSPGHASDTSWLPLIVAFFTTVAARRRAAAVGALVIGYLVSVWPPWLIGTPTHTTTFALSLLCGLLAMLTAAELLRAAIVRRLAQQRIRLEELRRIAADERIRIARDLHDVVAHNISVINVQANTALHLRDRQPERAWEALATINDVSRQALVELRSVLGVLRGLDGGAADSAPRAPVPGLARLGELTATMADVGLEVRVEWEGTPAPLAAGVDMAAYRIIQESLTNSARYSGSGRATVHIRHQDSYLEVEVDDDVSPGGQAPVAVAASGSGHGIAGMTERAQALGGTLRAGPRPGGGFRVTARLPVTGSTR